jgi:hypothetical protein
LPVEQRRGTGTSPELFKGRAAGATCQCEVGSILPLVSCFQHGPFGFIRRRVVQGRSS